MKIISVLDKKFTRLFKIIFHQSNRKTGILVNCASLFFYEVQTGTGFYLNFVFGYLIAKT